MRWALYTALLCLLAQGAASELPPQQIATLEAVQLDKLLRCVETEDDADICRNITFAACLAETSGSHADESKCNRYELTLWRKLYAQAVAGAVARAAGADGGVSHVFADNVPTLIRSEAAWLDWVDLQCDAEMLVYGAGNGPMTARPHCMMHHYIQRIHYLNHLDFGF